MTGFEERRRALRAAEAARVEDGSVPVGTPEQEAASVQKIQAELDQAREKLANLPEDTAPLDRDAAASDVTALEGALVHAQEAQALSEGKVETGVPLAAKVEDGTAGTPETTPAEPVGATSPADRVDEVSTSTGARVSESEPKAEPTVGEPTVTLDNTRAEIDAFAAERGIDTTGAPNKQAALDLIAAK